MFDWLRERTKSAETRQQERITAYVDNQLSDADRQQFEAQLRDDAALQAEVSSLQQLKTGLQMMPRTSAPRNFILDPAEFAKPAPAYEARAYPLLRGATVMAGLMLMLLLVFGGLSTGGGDFAASESIAVQATPVQPEVMADAAEMVMEEAVEEEMMAEMAEPVFEEEVVEEAEPILEAEAMLIPENDASASDDETGAAEVQMVPMATASPMPQATESADEGEMMDAEPMSEDVQATAVATAPPASRSAEATAQPTLPLVVLPTETAVETKALPQPTLAPEIQPSSEIADHSTVETVIEQPLVETELAPPRNQPSAFERIAWGVGILFILLLLITLLIRQRLTKF